MTKSNVRIYLDHAAATPLEPRVRAAMEPYESDAFFNPSAPYAPAWEVRHAYEAARADLAHAIGAKPAEIVVTAGATESVNLAFSVCRDAAICYSGLSPTGPKHQEEHGFDAPSTSVSSAQDACADPAAKDAHGPLVVVSAIEHASVLACARSLPHAILPVNKHGLVDPASVREAVGPHTRLVSVGLANNEIGTVQPLREIASVVAELRQERLRTGNPVPLYLHSDASQCAGQVDVNVSTLGIDLLTLNAAKIYGPKQVGLLWAARGVPLQPVVLGGGQERGLRSGTENVAGVVGFACALQLAVARRKDEAKRLAHLRDYMERRLTEEFPDAVVSGHKRRRLPGLLHISFPGLDAERLVYVLEEQGVCVGTGAACAANKSTRSHVLEAIGLDETLADGSLRLSFGLLSTDENTVRAAMRITDAVRGEYERVRREGERMERANFWDTEPKPPKGLW